MKGKKMLVSREKKNGPRTWQYEKIEDIKKGCEPERVANQGEDKNIALLQDGETRMGSQRKIRCT